MAKKKDFFQVGICPNCSSQTRQQFLFAVNDYVQPDIPQYWVVRTFSLFRCEGCRSLSLYETKFEDAQILPKDKRDEWLVDLRSYGFSALSKPVYSTPPLNYWKTWFRALDVDYTDPQQVNPTFKELIYRDSPNLDPAAPEAVRQCYEIGVAVRPISLGSVRTPAKKSA